VSLRFDGLRVHGSVLDSAAEDDEWSQGGEVLRVRVRGRGFLGLGSEGEGSGQG
jgi:hypothetical protein